MNYGEADKIIKIGIDIEKGKDIEFEARELHRGYSLLTAIKAGKFGAKATNLEKKDNELFAALNLIGKFLHKKNLKSATFKPLADSTSEKKEDAEENEEKQEEMEVEEMQKKDMKSFIWTERNDRLLNGELKFKQSNPTDPSENYPSTWDYEEDSNFPSNSEYMRSSNRRCGDQMRQWSELVQYPFEKCEHGVNCEKTDARHFLDFWHPSEHPRERAARFCYEVSLDNQVLTRDIRIQVSDDLQVSNVFLKDSWIVNSFRTDAMLYWESSLWKRTRSGRRRVLAPEKEKPRAVRKPKVPLTEEQKEELERQAELRRLREIEIKKNRLKEIMNKTDEFLKEIGTLLHQRDGVEDSEKLDEFMSTGGRSAKRLKQSPNLKHGHLKEYQEVALDWLYNLRKLRINGILADEMGLGKTIETIALLGYIKHVENVSGLHIIVVPESTTYSWEKAFQQWLPDFKVFTLQAQGFKDKIERHQALQQIRRNKFDVILTGYSLCLKDIEYLSKYNYCYLVVDEGHRLKNPNSKTFQALNSLRTENRLILTGTPLQNNLEELWSLLNFLIPCIFNSSVTFQDWFEGPLSRSVNKQTIIKEATTMGILHRLQSILNPFMLRRTKDEVTDLKKKEIIIVKCPMSGPQANVYKAAQENCGLTLDGKAKSFMNVIQQLRRAASHPYQFRNDTYNITHSLITMSGKFVCLDNMLPKLFEFDHKVLIFCQFKRTLDLLEEYFLFREYDDCYFRLDGDTSQKTRKEQLREFEQPDSKYKLFILSTRAGGLGINLQSADTVIIFEGDWNPQMDIQAEARAHRIGQSKEVRVFKLICEGSVDEHILERADVKRDLEKKVIGSAKYDGGKTNAEQKRIFREKILTQVDGRKRIQMSGKSFNSKIARGRAEAKKFAQMEKDKSFDWVKLDSRDKWPMYIAPLVRQTEENLVYEDGVKRRTRKLFDLEELDREQLLYIKQAEKKDKEDAAEPADSKGKRRRKRRREPENSKMAEEGHKKKKAKITRKKKPSLADEKTKETHVYGDNYFSNMKCSSVSQISRLFDIPLEVFKHNNNRRDLSDEPLKASDQFTVDTLTSVKRRKIDFSKLDEINGKFYTRSGREKNAHLNGDILHFTGGKVLDIQHVQGDEFTGKLWVWHKDCFSFEGQILGDVSLKKDNEKTVVSFSSDNKLTPPLLKSGSFVLTKSPQKRKVQAPKMQDKGTKKRKTKTKIRPERKAQSDADPNVLVPTYELNEEVQVIHSDKLWYPARIIKIVVGQFKQHPIVYKLEWVHEFVQEGQKKTGIPEKGVRPQIYVKGDPVKIWNHCTHSYYEGRISQRCRGVDERLRSDWKYKVFDVKDNSETDWVGPDDLVLNWRERNEDVKEKNKKLEEIQIIRNHVGKLFDRTIKAFSSEGKRIRAATPQETIEFSLKKGMKVFAMSNMDGHYGEARVVKTKLGRKSGVVMYKIEWDNGEEDDTWKRKRQLAPVEAFD